MEQCRYIYESKIGRLLIVASEKAIEEIDHYKLDDELLYQKTNKVIDETVKQLEEYFNGERQKFDLPLEFSGTEFQNKVWRSLLNIPYGETRTYKDIAKVIGNEKAVRAVGGANNKNKISIVVPCHRVIGSNNKLVGYAGGLERKEQLLKLESSKY